MAEPKASKVRKGLIDPLIGAAVLFFFLMAVVFASAPAINAGPTTLAGLLLLIGLGGVTCLGLFALRGTSDAPAEDEAGAERLIDALSEPAAVAAPDGRVKASNAAWKSAIGMGARLPKSGASAASLFAALTTARRGETGHASIKSGGAEHEALVSQLGARRFLVRLTGPGTGALQLPTRGHGGAERLFHRHPSAAQGARRLRRGLAVRRRAAGGRGTRSRRGSSRPTRRSRPWPAAATRARCSAN